MLAPATSQASGNPLDLLRLTLTAPWPYGERLLARLTVRALRYARELQARRQASAAQPVPTSHEATRRPSPVPPITVAIAVVNRSCPATLPDNTADGDAPSRVTPRVARSPHSSVSRAALRVARRAAALALRAHKIPRSIPEMHVVLNE